MSKISGWRVSRTRNRHRIPGILLAHLHKLNPLRYVVIDHWHWGLYIVQGICKNVVRDYYFGLVSGIHRKDHIRNLHSWSNQPYIWSAIHAVKFSVEYESWWFVIAKQNHRHMPSVESLLYTTADIGLGDTP